MCGGVLTGGPRWRRRGAGVGGAQRVEADRLRVVGQRIGTTAERGGAVAADGVGRITGDQRVVTVYQGTITSSPLPLAWKKRLVVVAVVATASSLPCSPRPWLGYRQRRW